MEDSHSKPRQLPSVSCIIAAYDAERYLAATLASVLAQTLPVTEIVVVDDGSRDSTAAIAESFGAPVRVIRQPNAGPAAARNLGIAETDAELLAFLDADDLWEPTKLAVQIPRFVEEPGLDYSVTMLRNFVSEELADRRVRDARLLEPIPGYGMMTLVARRSLFERIGTFDETLGHCDDTEWFLRARESGARFELIEAVLSHRRLHDGNRSSQAGEDSRKEYLELIKRMLDRRRSGTERGRGD